MEPSLAEESRIPESEGSPTLTRRFRPEVIPTSSHSSRTSNRETTTSADSPQRVQPRPFENSITSSISYNPSLKSSPQSDVFVSNDGRGQASSEGSATVRRKFAPQLVGTTSRRRKSTDPYPCIQPEDKTDSSPGDHHNISNQTRLMNTPVTVDSLSIASDGHVPQVPESRFSSEAISRRKPRQHSFRVPELPVIQSTIEESESPDKSKVPSLSTSPSADSDGAEAEKKTLADHPHVETRTKSGHLVSYAARSAEKQLREQVIAAYPNEHDNERVHHFAAESSLYDSDDPERQPAHEVEQQVPRRRSEHVHFEGPEQTQIDKLKDHPSHDQRRRSKLNSVAREHERLRERAVACQEDVKDREMSVMRKAASPPMAGEGLHFRKCRSPRNTRLDCGNYPNAPKSVTQSHHSLARGGLWGCERQVSGRNSPTGLWMGVCGLQNRKEETSELLLQSGILTPPAVEHEDPMKGTGAEADVTSLQLTPPLPHTESFTASLTSVLSTEQAIDREFPDNFVTVVYDYCSLGYPSMARKYDEELAKITKIPIEQIRKDDNDDSPRGHIGIRYGILEGFGASNGPSDDRDPTPVYDERWKALRLYIREWARQSPQMLGQPGRREWGESARKGSWAI